MGRFSAPDDAQVGGAEGAAEAEPMDWTLISDDEHEQNNTNSHDDVMMLARMQLNDNSPADENDGCVAGEDSTSTSRGAMVAYNNTASLPASASEMMENNNDDDDDRRSPLHNNAMTDNNSNGNNNNVALLQMTQQCLQQLQLSNDYNHLHQMQIEENYEQQRRRRKRNKKIILSILTIASIVTFVLKIHAPPPPPLVKQNSILALLEKKNYFMLEEGDASLLSSLVGESSSSSSISSNTNVNDITITHHETWGEYTSHIAQMTSTAIVYVASVFWYVVSNSFKYAALDLRDSIVAVMDNFRLFLSSSTIVATSDDGDESNGNVIQVNRERVACPIRIQAAWNRHALLPRGVANHNNINNNNDDNDDNDATIMEGLSTEESLRQQLTSLPSQDIALQQIAQGIDSWGESMLEDTTFTVDVLHRMARFMTRMGSNIQSIADSSSSASSEHNAVQYEHDTTDRSDINDKENVTLEWILPPAKGFLFVGPAGVGKLHVAQHLANWFFSHCNGSSSSSESSDHSCTSNYDDADNKEVMREPVLEIVAAGENAQGGDEVSIRRSIVEHIQQRKGLGSVVIIHHIEHLGDDGLLSDIVKVLNGHTNTISYSHDDTEKVASCEGTVFLLTTEQWGTKRLFQMIQQNDGLENLPREGLISAIRWEVDSHLQYWQRLNSHTTIVPFLPFQQDDLLLVLQSWFRELSEKYQGTLWARLDVSTSAIEYIVGADQVNYLDLYNGGHLQPTKMREGDESQQSSSKPLFTFSANGAHALYENSIYTALKSKLKNSTRRRPYNAAFLGVDQDTLDYILSWCDPVYTDSNECEIHWRLPVTFS